MKKEIREAAFNMALLACGIALHLKAVELACAERGYAAIGGEWLVLPVVALFAHAAKDSWDRNFVTYDVLEEVDGCGRRATRNR